MMPPRLPPTPSPLPSPPLSDFAVTYTVSIEDEAAANTTAVELADAAQTAVEATIPEEESVAVEVTIHEEGQVTVTAESGTVAQARAELETTLCASTSLCVVTPMASRRSLQTTDVLVFLVERDYAYSSIDNVAPLLCDDCSSAVTTQLEARVLVTGLDPTNPSSVADDAVVAQTAADGLGLPSDQVTVEATQLFPPMMPPASPPAPPPAPPPTPPPASPSGYLSDLSDTLGLSAGAIVGIVIAAIIAVLFCCTAVVYRVYRARRNQEGKNNASMSDRTSLDPMSVPVPPAPSEPAPLPSTADVKVERI